MLILQNTSYTHPNKDLLFDNISLTVNDHEKIALIGNNGAGKSTLLKIIAGELQITGGQVKADVSPYTVPQIFGQYNHLTVAEALQAGDKLRALNEILDGHATEDNFNILNDDWTIEERCLAALQHWQLEEIDLHRSMATLSGGQKTKVFLAGISVHQPGFVLLDEPSNHLDVSGRELLYDFICSTSYTLVVVSHDRTLLNLMDKICELSKRGITVYGGNYDFYTEQKEIASSALDQDIHSKEKALRKAREKEKETAERQQKLDARGKGKQEKAGVSRIMMNTLRNNAEKSTSRTKSIHAEKIGGISEELHELRKEVADINKMKVGFENSALHKGKILFAAKGMNFGYSKERIWQEELSFQLSSGERVSLEGTNGSGKTTLIKLILGNLQPTMGKADSYAKRTVYIDQDYSLIEDKLSVYEQAQQFNVSQLQEHEIKIRLSRFLFTREDWDKSCGVLSGGEKMRLMLCCLTVHSESPDMIILDEPTNNLDIQNVEILTNAINEYRGTLIVVSHDAYFLARINVERVISLAGNDN